MYESSPYPAEEGDDSNNSRKDSVDNFTPDEQSEQDELVDSTTNDSAVSDNDEGGLSDSSQARQSVSVEENSASSTGLPGETLTDSKDAQPPSRTAKKKQMRFSSEVSDDHSGVHSSVQSADSGETEKEINTNNNSAVDTEEPAESGLQVHDSKSESSNTIEPRRGSSSEEAGNTKHVNEGENTTNTIDKKEEKVLIELNGKFELVSVKELQTMGYPLPAELCNESTPGKCIFYGYTYSHFNMFAALYSVHILLKFKFPRNWKFSGNFAVLLRHLYGNNSNVIYFHQND